MILELALFTIAPAQQAGFEAAFTEARKLIAAAPGHLSHQLQRCIETDGRYVLLVQWQSVEHHVVGFRQSPLFQQWRSLLGAFFAAPPAVEHYRLVTSPPDSGGP